MGIIKPAYPCMLTLAMDIVGGKWKMVILWQLRNGVFRFSEIKRILTGITQKMLTQQLRELGREKAHSGTGRFVPMEYKLCCRSRHSAIDVLFLPAGRKKSVSRAIVSFFILHSKKVRTCLYRQYVYPVSSVGQFMHLQTIRRRSYAVRTA